MEAGYYARAGRARPYVERALILVIGSVLMLLDLGGFSHKSGAYSTNIWNALVDPFYAVAHREESTVVLMTDRDLQDLGETYPPRAAMHASVVNLLGRLQPRAVLIDLIFTQERDDPTFANLVDEIRAFKKATGKPIFLAAVSDADGRRVPFRQDIEALLTEGAAVPVSVVRNNRDWLSQIYLMRYQGLESGALALYRQACAGRACAKAFDHGFEVPLYIVWSSAVAPFNVRQGCEPQPSLMGRLWHLTFGHFPELQCAYTPTLEVSSLLTADPQDAQIVDRVKDRIVLYGAGLSGMSDIVTPPFHRALPGVYAHAMATDNLLQWGPRYYRVELAGLEFIEHFKVIEIVAIALVLFLPFWVMPAMERHGWTKQVLRLLALDQTPKRTGPLVWTPLLGMQRWLRRHIPGLALTVVIIGLEVFVLDLVPLNWIAVLMIAVLGELAERRMGRLTNFVLFVLYSPQRGRFPEALVDRDAAGIVRAELATFAAAEQHEHN
jgi:CHASE2 domain-containing sensor protein